MIPCNFYYIVGTACDTSSDNNETPKLKYKTSQNSGNVTENFILYVLYHRKTSGKIPLELNMYSESVLTRSILNYCFLRTNFIGEYYERKYEFTNLLSRENFERGRETNPHTTFESLIFDMYGK